MVQIYSRYFEFRFNDIQSWFNSGDFNFAKTYYSVEWRRCGGNGRKAFWLITRWIWLTLNNTFTLPKLWSANSANPYYLLMIILPSSFEAQFRIKIWMLFNPFYLKEIGGNIFMGMFIVTCHICAFLLSHSIL